jgi:integrase
MARAIHRLTSLQVQRTKGPNLLHDGGGLYLQVTENHAKSWVLRYMINRRQREMGLGSLELVSLQQARQAALEAKRLARLQGVDPIEQRKVERAERSAAAAKTITFGECCDGYVTDHERGWVADHRQVWVNSVRDYVTPVLGKLPVHLVDTALVLKVLKPIWNEKHVTASRLRARIEAVLDWATAHHYRQGPNPAAWRNHLALILDKTDNVHRVKHHAALPYAEVGGLVAELRERDDRDARCLELLILTAVRVDAAIGARAEEFDLSRKVWVIPPERMKRRGKRKALPFRVPLSDVAIDLIERNGVTSGLLFPKANGRALGRMHGRANVTTHGFRSCFRDWVADKTSYPAELAEMSLSHSVSDETEEAYFRSDLLEKRRPLMQAWSDFCGWPADKSGAVVPLRKRA